jgi:hypothetical protein
MRDTYLVFCFTLTTLLYFYLVGLLHTPLPSPCLLFSYHIQHYINTLLGTKLVNLLPH